MRHTMAPNITVHDLIALAPLSPRPTLFVHQVSGYLLRVPFVDSHQVEARVSRLDSAKSRGETGVCGGLYMCTAGEQEGQVERFVQPVAPFRGTYEVG